VRHVPCTCLGKPLPYLAPQTPPFPLRIRLCLYNIPIVLSLDSLSISLPYIRILTNPFRRIAGSIFYDLRCLRRQDRRLHSTATRWRHDCRTPQDLVLEAHQQNLRDLLNLKTIRYLQTLETSSTYIPRLNRSLVRLPASYRILLT